MTRAERVRMQHRIDMQVLGIKAGYRPSQLRDPHTGEWIDMNIPELDFSDLLKPDGSMKFEYRTYGTETEARVYADVLNEHNMAAKKETHFGYHPYQLQRGRDKGKWTVVTYSAH